MTTLPSSVPEVGLTHGRGWVLAQVLLALLAAAILAFRAVRTAIDGPAVGTVWVVAGVGLASVAALMALGAAVVARRPGRWSAGLLAGALGWELVVLGAVAAPPRLIAALPLVLALALAVLPGRPADSPRTRSDPGTPRGAPRLVAAVLALGLMVPVGFFHLASGLVVPVPWLLGVYVLFGVEAFVAVRLASRRSWWVLACPAVAAALLFAVVWAGETYLGWTG